MLLQLLHGERTSSFDFFKKLANPVCNGIKYITVMYRGFTISVEEEYNQKLP